MYTALYFEELNRCYGTYKKKITVENMGESATRTDLIKNILCQTNRFDFLCSWEELLNEWLKDNGKDNVDFTTDLIESWGDFSSDGYQTYCILDGMGEVWLEFENYNISGLILLLNCKTHDNEYIDFYYDPDQLDFDDAVKMWIDNLQKENLK